jgi:hypothetical protein
MFKQFRPRAASRLRDAAFKSLVVVGLNLLIAITASAYTLVFKDGRRIEIPSEFTLTRTTLTYEISPGFNQTMLVTLIDIAATERANSESAGGFFRHREETTPAPGQPSGPAVRTLTNIDLDQIRQRRVESEQAYEARRKQLGLPTVEESRRRQDADAVEVRAMAREEAAANGRNEAYWKGRARDLRNEIAMLDTQIGYLRGRVNEANEAASQNQTYVTGVYPTWPNGRWGRNGGRGGYPNARYPGNQPARPIIGLGLPNIYGNPNIYGYPNVYGYPGTLGYPNGNSPAYSSDPAELNSRLDDLLVRRAGLAAEWQQLEDEARDARVPQVWLEP